MNCIIIDDDEFFTNILAEYVKLTEFLHLLGTYNNPVDAMTILNSGEPIDLIFLDVETPKMDGIEFLKNVANLPSIIIISAQEHYALAAFEHDVVDYLKKPIKYGRFIKAVDKAYQQHKISTPEKVGSEHFFVKQGQTLTRLKYSEIVWIEALENYITIYTADKKYTILHTMKNVEQRLPSDQFIRVHRSFIVNIEHILSIEENNIVLQTKAETKHIPIRKRHKSDLITRLNLLNRE